MGAIRFPTNRSRFYMRDPDDLTAITQNIARCLGEMIAYPQQSPSARQELELSLEDYANYIIRAIHETSAEGADFQSTDMYKEDS
jgi:hypothetical protein